MFTCKKTSNLLYGEALDTICVPPVSINYTYLQLSDKMQQLL